MIVGPALFVPLEIVRILRRLHVGKQRLCRFHKIAVQLRVIELKRFCAFVRRIRKRPVVYVVFRAAESL